jgi:hypothetical protein
MKDAELQPYEILDRLAEVSALLHEEKGDRPALLLERSQLVHEARRRGIIRPATERPLVSR